MEVTTALSGAVKRKVKKKIWLWLIGAGMPLLIFLSIVLAVCMFPLFILGGDSLYYSPGYEYDMYYGSESGGAAFKLTGTGEFLFPINTQKIVITSGFGMRMHPVLKERKLHTGIDIACDTGTPVLAVSGGTVSFAGDGGGYGNLVIIEHPGGYKTYYAHLSVISINNGTVISAGELIGKAGNTGFSTGPHLHFEVRKDDSPIDPAPFLGLVQDIPNVLPEELKYTEIDAHKLKTFLDGRDSMLSDEPYFSAIMDSAREYDVSPVLLFAITGQEQSFVPRSHKDAIKIANNPFNVFHSWREYNTDIRDSSRIAARTVINLSKNRPDASNPIAWMNTRGGSGGYAEDPNWWVGVSKIFNQLRQVAAL
ncbi:peptidase M23-like protein [Anaerobacterium chartisolvens]|uniref:Peptidase M23-like protein n=1 Tax=Anaerobacterium chartisolvens TaxID=1297424 RepID=A0A369AM35_9FIRM|nr:M23 family metallopeptidase [Anaerobacterium chartisolvens]RCX10440.1 peptidase M23-like protein [Anaerobacterium chartisolvens]